MVQLLSSLQKKKKSQMHHTVDTTLTKDRSLLNFVSRRMKNELASFGENSTSFAAWLMGKNHAFSSVGAMVKINWF